MLQENTTKYKKLTDGVKKEYVRLQQQKKQHQDQILENEIMIAKLKKQQAEIHYEMRGQRNKAETLKEQIVEIENKMVEVKGRVSDSENYKKSILDQIAKREKTLVDLKKNVQLTEKQVNNLTEMRESMARKASSAMAEVRATREELKVKELLILDLTKKYQ